MAVEVTVGVRGRPGTPTATSAGRARRHRREAGAVTAEAAAVLPLLVAVTLGLVWLLALVSTQARVVDAARETARLAARGEPDSHSVAAGSQVAPAGATLRVAHDGSRIVVDAAAEVRGPGGLFRFLPGVTVRSRAVTTEEPQ